MQLLKLAEEKGGMLTFSETRKNLPAYGNDKPRFDRAMKQLLADGLAWEDRASAMIN